jgi:hypothetical protein
LFLIDAPSGKILCVEVLDFTLWHRIFTRWILDSSLFNRIMKSAKVSTSLQLLLRQEPVEIRNIPENPSIRVAHIR